MTTPPQMYRLAKSLETGTKETPKNLSQAFQIYSTLAKQNYPPALISCAYCLCHGVGTAIDIAKAVRLAKEAMALELADDEKNICFFVLGYGCDFGYFEGETWVRNKNQAEYYYQLSYEPYVLHGRPAKPGFYLAGIFLGRYYALHKQINKAQGYFFSEIATLVRRAGQQDPVAQLRLGSCYFFGQGKHQNKKKAYGHYKHAAIQNIPMAQYNLGVMYSEGKDPVSKDDAYAAEWFLRAAKQGLIFAQVELAKCYEQGLGVSQDLTLAMFYLQQAAKTDSFARQAWRDRSCSIVDTEVLPSQAAFTSAKDPRPILVSVGGEDSVVMAGYETINQIAFMALFTHPKEVEMSQNLILDNLFRLASEKIASPIQITFSYRRLSKNLKATILAAQAIFANTLTAIYLTQTKAKRTLMLDARTGRSMEYIHYPPTQVALNPSGLVEVVYRPDSISSF